MRVIVFELLGQPLQELVDDRLVVVEVAGERCRARAMSALSPAGVLEQPGGRVGEVGDVVERGADRPAVLGEAG